MRVKQKTAAPPRISQLVTNVEKLDPLERLERLEQSKTKTRCSVGWNPKSPERLERLKPPNPYGSMKVFDVGVGKRSILTFRSRKELPIDGAALQSLDRLVFDHLLEP